MAEYGRASANLVQEHYLHSSKWTFFNNAHQLSNLDLKNTSRGNTKIDRLIKQLEKTSQTAKTREQEFYTDFGVKNNIEWANKYLLRGGANDSDRQKILDVINSPTMISLLTTGGQDFEATQRGMIQYFKEQLNKSNIPRDIVEYMLDKAIHTNALDISQFFEEVGFIGKGETTIKNKTYTNKEIQKWLFEGFKSSGKNFTPPKKILTSVYSDYLKKYQQQIEKVLTRERQRANSAIKYLREQLELKGLSKDKITTVVQVFEREINKNLSKRKNNENRLVSSANNLVTGEVSEVGEVIAYIDFDNPFNYDAAGRVRSINSMVTQLGRDLVDRAGNKVKSKVDTIWTGPSTGKKYFMQNKNSNAEIYRQFQLTNDFEKLLNYPSFLTIQSNVSLPYLMEQFTNYHILSEEDKDSLIYLLINYNVLNKFSAKNESTIAKGVNDDNIPPAVRTQAAIDQYISQGLQYFLSDLLPQELVKSSDDEITNRSNDFIIFMDRFLIPKSTILDNLIEFLNDYTQRALSIYTTTSKGKFSNSDYESMVLEKIAARAEEEDGSGRVEYDYHNANLVQAGAEWGQVAYDEVKISRVNIKFTINNLVAKQLI